MVCSSLATAETIEINLRTTVMSISGGSSLAMMGFLARWARRLSWRETAQVFQTSWESVYRSVGWFVQWGLAHRQLRGVESIGVDEIHWGRGLRADNFLTVIYQIDAGCRRLLWV